MLFALVSNGQIVVGPREYHQGIFVRYLIEKNIDYSMVPVVFNMEGPLVIDNNHTIIPVERPVEPEHNPITEQCAGPFWTITPNLITGTYNIVDTSIEFAKNKLIDLVANVRYLKEVKGIKVTLQGNEVAISTQRGSDRDIWTQMLNSMADGSTIKFKFNNRTQLWLDLSKVEVTSIITSIMTYVQTCFVWERDQQISIEAASSKTELEVIYSSLKDELNQLTTLPR